jgi:hypothetical protein
VASSKMNSASTSRMDATELVVLHPTTGREALQAF